MYTKVFLDPVIIHQQASAQDLSNPGFSSFSQAQSDRTENWESHRTQHILRESSSYIQGRKHKSGSRYAQHSSDFICIRRAYSPYISRTPTSDGCIKPLPLIRLSFVFQHLRFWGGRTGSFGFIGTAALLYVYLCFTASFLQRGLTSSTSFERAGNSVIASFSLLFLLSGPEPTIVL